MTDIFISYSHKDADLARSIVAGLEAEGFSVGWDHSIPPGKTWDDVIARGISTAKACVIIWSPQSVSSDWVKEEATLAKDAGKYLPVQVGVASPPMGFRRIQAADLAHWNGNSQDAQWRLLVAEASTLVRGTPPPLLQPSAAPPRSPRSGARRTWLIGIGSAGIALLAAAVLLRSGSQSAPGGATPAPAPYPPAPVPVPAPPVPSGARTDNSPVGVWHGYWRNDTDPPGTNYPYVATYLQDGTVTGSSLGQTGTAPWYQIGREIHWGVGALQWQATVNGDKLHGRFTNPQHTGTFEATRSR